MIRCIACGGPPEDHPWKHNFVGVIAAKPASPVKAASSYPPVGCVSGDLEAARAEIAELEAHVRELRKGRASALRARDEIYAAAGGQVGGYLGSCTHEQAVAFVRKEVAAATRLREEVEKARAFVNDMLASYGLSVEGPRPGLAESLTRLCNRIQSLQAEHRRLDGALAKMTMAAEVARAGHDAEAAEVARLNGVLDASLRIIMAGDDGAQAADFLRAAIATERQRREAAETKLAAERERCAKVAESFADADPERAIAAIIGGIRNPAAGRGAG